MRGRLRQVLYAKSHQNRIEIARKIACVNGPLYFVIVEHGVQTLTLLAFLHVSTLDPEELKTFKISDKCALVSLQFYGSETLDLSRILGMYHNPPPWIRSQFAGREGGLVDACP